ncbi:MAG: helix-turn-helix transcriptional regulator [Oscillospiraceae bacterium]|nr:helix-turn-helix transcriptional regulator [Oscillospiraceae bacterium]
MNLGENIYRLRIEHNMSQGDLADALEVSRQSVSKWENNNAVPDLDRLIKMSVLFDVSLDQLVGNESPAQPFQDSACTDTPPQTLMSIPRILGIILLSFGLLAFLVLTLLGGILVAIPLCLPFVIVGIICMVCKDHLLFRCTWALFGLYLPIVILFVMNVIGYRFAITIICGVLACFAALAFWTIVGIRRGWLNRDVKRFIVVCVAVLLLVTAVSTTLVSIRLSRSGLKNAAEAELPAVIIDSE